MWLTIKLVYESFLFALSALRENLLRTVLSLLGVTIGIFAIIGVLTMVDAIEKGIRQSLAFMGDKVIYVDVFPWNFTDRDYPWWKYFQRPNPTYNEFKFLERNLSEASAVAVFAVRGNNTVKFRNSSLSGVNMLGVSQQYNQASKVEVEQGRYFNAQENERGRNVVILGHTVAKELFGDADPVGQQVTLRGNKFSVIGIMKRQGTTLLNTPSTDNVCMIPYTAMTKLFSSGRRRGLRPQIMLKGYDNDSDLVLLENEARGLLRAYRGLKPREDDNFALNRPEAFAVLLDSIITVMTSAGWFISIFSMLVGGFGIANIMFVSVKERTNLIGIQKSLGAKNFFILFQFLYEAVLLCVIGGIAGLLLVSLLSLLSTESFEISLSMSRITLGLVLASVIGIISGIVPAIVAARMDPVVAIRSK